MIDTHCHLGFDDFKGRADEEIARMRDAGVDLAITISTSSADALRSRDLAMSHPEVWHSAGIHPLYSDEPIDWGDLREASKSPKCVAWGELGLDRHHAKPAFDLQHRVLHEQLDRISRWRREDRELPIVIHCRKAFDDLLPILAESGLPRDRFVFHCFSGTPAEAKRVLDLGAWISFTGIVTYRNAPEVAAAAKLVPGDRIMVETDAPFLSPEPIRSAWPNRPANVVLVARALASIRGEEEPSFFRALDSNSRRFFGLPAATVA